MEFFYKLIFSILNGLEQTESNKINIQNGNNCITLPSQQQPTKVFLKDKNQQNSENNCFSSFPQQVISSSRSISPSSLDEREDGQQTLIKTNGIGTVGSKKRKREFARRQSKKLSTIMQLPAELMGILPQKSCVNTEEQINVFFKYFLNS